MVLSATYLDMPELYRNSGTMGMGQMLINLENLILVHASTYSFHSSFLFLNVLSRPSYDDTTTIFINHALEKSA